MTGFGALGIDLQSIIYYLVNYGIILSILGFYVYPKIHGALEKRQKEIVWSVDDASKLKSELAAELASFHEKHEVILSEAREQKKKWLQDLENIKTDMLAQMEQKKIESLQETQEMMDQKKSALMDDVKKEIYGLIQRSFLSVSKKIPENIVQESIDDAWNQLPKNK